MDALRLIRTTRSAPEFTEGINLFRYRRFSISVETQWFAPVNKMINQSVIGIPIIKIIASIGKQ